MSLTDEQRKHYEKVVAATQAEMEDIDRLIEEELRKTRERVEELQNAKNASRQTYDAACLRLGIPNDLGAEEDAPLKDSLEK